MVVSAITGSDGRHGSLNIVINGYHIKGWQVDPARCENDSEFSPLWHW